MLIKSTCYGTDWTRARAHANGRAHGHGQCGARAHVNLHGPEPHIVHGHVPGARPFMSSLILGAA